MGPYYFFGGSGPTFFCSVNQPEMAQAGSQNIFVVKKEVKTVVRVHNLDYKEILYCTVKKYWSFRPFGNSSISLQKLWVRTTFLAGPDPLFSVV